MLVLTRKEGESILIGDDIEVKVICIKGRNQVQIGIDAPKQIRVMRPELLERENGQGVRVAEGNRR